MTQILMSRHMVYCLLTFPLLCQLAVTSDPGGRESRRNVSVLLKDKVPKVNIFDGKIVIYLNISHINLVYGTGTQ